MKVRRPDPCNALLGNLLYIGGTLSVCIERQTRPIRSPIYQSRFTRRSRRRVSHLRIVYEWYRPRGIA